MTTPSAAMPVSVESRGMAKNTPRPKKRKNRIVHQPAIVPGIFIFILLKTGGDRIVTLNKITLV